MLGTIEKVGQLLDLFSNDHPEWGVTEVATELGVSKSSAHSLLATLDKIGLLCRIPNGRYRLGWRVLTLNYVLLGTTGFRAEAGPVMQELIDRFGETVHLAALEGGEVVYVAKLQGTRAVRVAVTAVGVRISAHCTGVGKVLLAYRPLTEVEVILEGQGGLKAFTPNTITCPDRLRQELKHIREQGYAYDVEEAVEDLCCVAAPIRDHTGWVVASMSLSVPAYRFQKHREEYRAAIVEATWRISRNIGYIPQRKKEETEWRYRALRTVR